MTKKQMREIAKKQRVWVPFNTGTRTMKTEKYPTRQARKAEARKESGNV